MDKNTFLKSISVLESAFKEKMSKGAINIYWARLKNYNDKKFKEAVIRCTDELNYFPKIAELKNMLEGSPADEAELAYLEFKKVLDNEGSYMSVSFSKYPAVVKVIEALGGWIRISDTLIDDEKWLRIQFKKLYPIMKRRGGYPEFPDKLVGRFELDNSNKGYNKQTMLGIYSRRLDGKKVDRKLIKEKNKEGDKTNDN